MQSTPANRDAEQIRELIALWHEATRTADVDTVRKLMTDDVVFLVAGKPPIRGRDAFVHGLKQVLAEHRIESSGEVQEVVVSGDLAYSWVHLIVKLIPRAGGEPNARTGYALSVLRRQPDGNWRVARDANLLPQA